jgi:curli biogenesis system outer membrane secretion channel CsgG
MYFRRSLQTFCRMGWRLIVFAMVAPVLSAGCATETHRTVESQTVATYGTAYDGPKYTLMVGKFYNRSSYMQGLFFEGSDRLGNQAKTILKTHLQQTNRFTVVDRDNMGEIAQEAKLRGEQQRLKGAQVAITGDVTEFGRRETGDIQLFGILGAGKKQLAYSSMLTPRRLSILCKAQESINSVTAKSSALVARLAMMRR